MYNYGWTEDPGHFSSSLPPALCSRRLLGTHARSVSLHKTLSQFEGTSRWLLWLEPGQPHPYLSWKKVSEENCLLVHRAVAFHRTASNVHRNDTISVFVPTGL